MLTNSFKAALIGGKVLTIGALMGTSALAQNAEVVTGSTTVVETPAANTAVLPGAAVQPGTPVGAVTDPGYPLLEQLDNDEAIATSLIGQGFSDIRILRDGAILTVNAQRNGQPTELVYSVANGSLISVDGVEMRDAPDATGDGQSEAMGTDMGGEDMGSDGEGATESDGTTDSYGNDAGESDSDSTSDSSDGGDAGGESGGGDSGGDTDGGDSGGDSDGGDSNG